MLASLYRWLALGVLLSACGTGTWEGGIHAQLAFSEANGLRVVDVPSGPAADADLRAGDWIRSIDGEAVEGLDLEQVRSRLRGPVGSAVELEVEREGETETLIVDRAPYRSNQLNPTY